MSQHGREREFAAIRQRADGMKVLRIFCHDCGRDEFRSGFKPVPEGTRFDAGEPIKCPDCGGVSTGCEVLPKDGK